MRDPVDHVRELAVGIGPRGATTEGERRGSEYARREMERWAASVKVEPFASCPSLSWPWGLVALLLLASSVLIWVRPWLAVATAAAGFLAFAGLARGSFEVGRLFPGRPSRNVLGIVRPRGEVRHRVILAAHVDTTRSALFYHPRRLHLFRLNHILNITTSGGLLLFSLLAALRIPPAVVWWQVLSLPLAVIALYGGYVLLHRELFCDYIPGANDNASGVAVALSVGEAVAAEPLETTELWCLITGCEEVGYAVGMDRFVRAHIGELRDADILVLDSVGAGHIRYLTGEGIMGYLPMAPDLVSLAAEVAGTFPEWDIRGTRFGLGYTDATPALMRGLRALALFTLDDRGLIRNYHWPSDTFENIEAETLRRVTTYTLALVRAIDRRRATGDSTPPVSGTRHSHGGGGTS